MILTTAQAKAVYDAMCALNNVGAKLNTVVTKEDCFNFTRVFERDDGDIRVVICVDGNIYNKEIYANQDNFATTYGVK